MKEIIKSNDLFKDLSEIIDQGKKAIVSYVNQTLTLVYWQVGHRINQEFLHNDRAEYAENIVSTVSGQLADKFGRGFSKKNVWRMIQFSKAIDDFEIVSTVSRQLSWSHFVEILPIENQEKRLFYLNKACEEKWSVRELRNQIERKTFERNEIAYIQSNSLDLLSSDITFKDPYFLDFLGLKEGYLENDLEQAILNELENFILELGKGFAFVERQKRMIIDGEDFYLDLLFYHRKLKRLVAIDLKIGKFKAAYKGQMELYLNWLDKNERQEGEEKPIGLILCTEKGKEQIELLEMGKNGIMVAEYWTELPPKNKLEEKIQKLLIETKERIERNKLL
ncbi:MAG: PDDEXK nuclease domain-containing protein [Crocinitomicaceae bacterium]|nr:PDDEXK nuclease domain-containing protein [Crocinitomicaceae bacterium]